MGGRHLRQGTVIDLKRDTGIVEKIKKPAMRIPLVSPTGGLPLIAILVGVADGAVMFYLPPPLENAGDARCQDPSA